MDPDEEKERICTDGRLSVCGECYDNGDQLDTEESSTVTNCRYMNVDQLKESILNLDPNFSGHYYCHDCHAKLCCYGMHPCKVCRGSVYVNLLKEFNKVGAILRLDTVYTDQFFFVGIW